VPKKKQSKDQILVKLIHIIEDLRKENAFFGEEGPKFTKVLINDIKLKHKYIADVKKYNSVLVDTYEDKFQEYIKANKELKKQNEELHKNNNELTRAYNGLAEMGKLATELGIDIKKHNDNLPESKKYNFSQKHTLLENGKVRHQWKASPKKEDK
jgi:hypothetical protein|tara:strand:+ start:391 stop:855 length:465 start_codon:yes stop_codon:yes gene_type:complete